MKKVVALSFVLILFSALLFGFRSHSYENKILSGDQDSAATVDVTRLYDIWWTYDPGRSTGNIFNKKIFFKNYGICINGSSKYTYVWKDETKGIMHVRGMWGMTTELVFKMIDEDEILFMYGETKYYYVRASERK